MKRKILSVLPKTQLHLGSLANAAVRLELGLGHGTFQSLASAVPHGGTLLLA